MSEISIIAAISKNRVIGNRGKIPWNIPEDKARFKNLTAGNVVIMGRKTFEDIIHLLKKPLPDRINFVLSKTKKNSTDDFIKYDESLSSVTKTFCDLNSAIISAKENYPDKEIFICGGESVYRESLDIADKIYLTKIDLNFEGDAFFPEFDENDFTVVKEMFFDESLKYRFIDMERKEVNK